MEKPIDLIVMDAKRNLIKVLNESNLPLSILNMIVNEVHTALINQLNTSEREVREQYEKSLEEQEG